MAVPHHHYGILHYINRLNVQLEPFTQVNFNAYVHNTQAYGGKPRRYREVMADYQGHVAELLGKCTQQGALDKSVSKEDREMLAEIAPPLGRAGQGHEICEGRNLRPVRGRCWT